MLKTHQPPLRLAGRFALVLILSASLSTCQWADRHPTVSSGDIRHDVSFAPDSVTLRPDATTRLREFIASLSTEESTYTTQDVYVVGAAAVAGPALPAARLIDQRTAAVAHELAAIGAPPRSGAPTVPIAPVLPDTVAVIVERSLVTLPACPDWSGSPHFSSYSNQPASNWSCATAVNLGMMVADPTDLQLGRQPGVAQADPAARSVQRYREGKTKPLSTDVSTAETFASDSGGSGGGGE